MDRITETSEGRCYPVHFQQNAGLALGIAIVGIRKAGADAQGAPLEATHFLCHFLRVVLLKILSLGAILILLLLCIVISWV